MTDTPQAPALSARQPVDTRNLSAMLLLALMWGLSIPVTKLGLVTMPPLTLTAFRFAVAVPILLALAVGKAGLPWKAVPAVAMLGIIGIGVGQVAQTYGVTGTSASVGTILSATIPLFIVLFAAIRLRQSVSPRQLAGVGAAFAGIIVVANAGGSAGSTTTFYGPAFMLLSALAVAFYYVWSVELTARYGTVVVVVWSTTFGFLALLPFAGFEAYNTPFEITATALGAAIYLGVVVTVAGLFLWLDILKRVPAPVAASVQYLQPVFGIIASSLIFGDSMGTLFAVGVVLILGGLALAIRQPRPV
ncbi:DMT family transporter [Agrobacterium sp. SOY23]|uniref:DMT family transporter n=1 Tax=Agrobacterium sp. SOY23 TaxID=3014555 RepID=UPI002F34FD3E